MKFSLALLAVFLPVIVNAQSDAGDVNVRRSYVIPSFFVDIPQVIVPDGALAYDPSNFTVSNGTDVNFLSAWYDFPSIMYRAMALTLFFWHQEPCSFCLHVFGRE
jgi:hypothetical protein